MGSRHSKTPRVARSSKKPSRFIMLRRAFMWRRQTKATDRQKVLRRSQKRLGSLRPIPRCSSFDSRFNRPAALKPKITLANNAHQDIFYEQWKAEFERSHLPSYPLAGEDSHVLDLSEALAGQLTPPGFPSYSEVRAFDHKDRYANAEHSAKFWIGEKISIEINTPTDHGKPDDTIDSAESEDEVFITASVKKPKSLGLRRMCSAAAFWQQYRAPRAKPQQAASAAKGAEDLSDVQEYFSCFNLV